MFNDVTSSPVPHRVFLSNRVYAIMLHIPWYTFKSRERLARDCKMSQSTINRIIRCARIPSYEQVRIVTEALEKRLGVPLSMREVFSTDGTYPTARVCDLTPDCYGCYPPDAYDEADAMKLYYRDLRPGDWCTYPPMEQPHAIDTLFQ